MATNTYVALDKVTVGTATPTVTFSSISGNYTDLRIVVQTAVNTETYMRFNADTGSNYSGTEIWAGTSANSERASNVTFITLRNSSSTLGNNMATVDVMNYSNSTTNKTVLVGTRDGLYDRVYRRVGMWRNTAAITSITFVPDAGNFPVGSTFSLYGIAAEGVSPAAKATGGAIYSDSTYYYHAFAASGTFTPTQSITADCLVVAGGAGGGRSGGGGGAGGLLAFTSQSLTATGYSITVGAGGAGNNTDGQTGTAGGDSQFAALTLIKGGGGGGSYGADGATGGSGGGGGGYEGGTKTGGAATSGQGSAGGNGFNGSSSINRAGGGGGGAGAVGAAATSAVGGNGGIGLSTYSSWGVATGIGQNVSGTYYLSGGGGGYAATGGTGGSGGGGGKGVNGTANTGGGGGGSASDGTVGFNGASGVVIVRYLKA
jgi:hypothetical protein